MRREKNRKSQLLVLLLSVALLLSAIPIMAFGTDSVNEIPEVEEPQQTIEGIDEETQSLDSEDISQNDKSLGEGIKEAPARTGVRTIEPREDGSIENDDFSYIAAENKVSIKTDNGMTTWREALTSKVSTIETVVIESGVTTIVKSAFEDCIKLISITIPDSVTTIGEYAFKGCYALTTVDIPANVTKIGTGAFQRCRALTSILIPAGVTTIEGDTFNSCEALTTIDIPEGVTTIGIYAIADTALTSITIPDSVTTIGGQALQGFNGSLFMRGNTPPSLGSWTFGPAGNPTIYVPPSAIDTYKNAQGWSTEVDKIKACPHPGIEDEDFTSDNNTEHWKICSKCGDKAEIVAHEFGAWTVETPATAGTAGTKSRTCSICNYQDKAEIAAHTPDWDIAWSKDADNHWHKCNQCEEIKDKAAHDFGAWTVDTKPTTTTPGSKHRDCTVCGYTETVTIPAERPVPPVHFHQWDVLWSKDTVNHWKVCLSCGEKAEIAAHTPSTWIIDQEATTEKEGSKHTECTICKQVLQTESIPKVSQDEYDYTFIQGKNAAWIKTKGGNLVFRINADYKLFSGVTIDGKILDKSNYTVKEGSTIITLKESYLKKLSAGNHTLKASFENKAVSTTFTIKTGNVSGGTDNGGNNNPADNPAGENPETGDMSYVGLWLTLLVLCSGLTISLVVKNKYKL